MVLLWMKKTTEDHNSNISSQIDSGHIKPGRISITVNVSHYTREELTYITNVALVKLLYLEAKGN